MGTIRKLLKCIRFSVFSVILFAGCYASTRSRPSTGDAFDENSLGTFLGKIDPWPSFTTNYAESNWALLVQEAKVMQNTSPLVAKKTLHQYQLLGCRDSDFQTTTSNAYYSDLKFFLLVRVVFDLPEAALAQGKAIEPFGEGSGGRLLPDQENIRERNIDMAWPIKWNGGRPMLDDPSVVLSGMHKRYDAAAEYQYFYAHYGYRDLAKWRPSR